MCPGLSGAPNLWAYASNRCGIATNKRAVSQIQTQELSILPRQSPCQIGLANKRCWICHNVTQNVCRSFSGAPELESNGSRSCGFARNQPVGVSYSDTAIQYHHDLLYCQIGLPNLWCAIYLNETHDIWPVFSGAPESGWIEHCPLFWLRHVYVARGFRCTSQSLLTNVSKPFSASCSIFDSGHSAWDRPARELVILLINWLHLILVINNNKQEHQWNPTRAVSD